MPVYAAKFPASAAGRTVTIKDQAGNTLATQTLSAAAGGRVRDSFTHAGTQEDEFTGTVQIPSGGQLQAQYTLDTPASIAAGGGGGGATDRGTLYLTASVTGASLNTANVAVGDGAVMAFELDPDKTSTGDWWTQTENGFRILQHGDYKYGIASKGTAHYPSGVPDLVNIDVYDNNLGGVNLGHASDGNDDCGPFDVDLVTELPFFCKEGTVTSTGSFHFFPYDLIGFVVDNNGDQASDATLDYTAKLSITQTWAGERYTEADFS